MPSAFSLLLSNRADIEGTAKSASDGFGDFALHAEEVSRWAIPSVSPNVRARICIYELASDPDTVRLELDRTLEHIRDAELGTHLANVLGLALVYLCRVAGDDIEILEARKIGDDILGDAVREPATLLGAGHVGERQNREARLTIGCSPPRTFIHHPEQGTTDKCHQRDDGDRPPPRKNGFA